MGFKILVRFWVGYVRRECKISKSIEVINYEIWGKVNGEVWFYVLGL